MLRREYPVVGCGWCGEGEEYQVVDLGQVVLVVSWWCLLWSEGMQGWSIALS